MKAAIYARYSSDHQRDASIKDQVRVCSRRIEQEGWHLIETYSDHAISGASTLRPGYQQMLMAARSGRFQVLVAEALDRLSRDQEDIAGLYKQLTFAGVKIITLAEGEINELHVGLKGTMNALFLKDLADKTRRGLEGRIRQGKSGGGKAYGYDIKRHYDANGELLRGDQAINEEEATIVRRIFTEYLAGRSPRAIAITFNKEAIPGPSGKGWTASTIIGNRKRGTGILNNQLYIGKRVWNRQRFFKDPTTGRRQARLNPERDWIVQEVAELRIIDDETWRQAQQRQESRTRDTRPSPGPDWRDCRPKHLFSGLIKCGSCGGGMSLVSRIYYGCAANRNKGTCDNRQTIRLDRLEATVLHGLQQKLVTPELTQAFIEEYTKEVNRLRAMASTEADHLAKQRAKLERQIDNIVEAVANGRTSSALLDKLAALKAERDKLAEASPVEQPTNIRMHPNLAEVYVQKVAELRECLNADDIKSEAAEVM